MRQLIITVVSKEMIRLCEHYTVIPGSDPESIALAWMPDQVRHDRVFFTQPDDDYAKRMNRFVLFSSAEIHPFLIYSEGEDNRQVNADFLS
jgi:hypothetical protein